MSNASRPPAEAPRFAELEADYEIVRELGRGGTAVVYLARERELDRLVAIKVMRSAYVEDEEAAARLVREARTVGRLQHPNIVMLYGTRRLRDGSLALIMQYVEGHTLRSEIRASGPLPAARVQRVLRDLGAALAHAHRRRIVHRDIKPENIYIDESGAARLSDFGIARPWGTDSNLTLPGAAIGTPAYMSPEQIDGGQLDGRSDLYGLGLVGWEMLTGRRPWSGESLFGIIYKQKHEALPPLAAERADLPDALVHAIEGALRKEPEDRWPDAETFLSVLRGGQALPEEEIELPEASRTATAPAPMPATEPVEPDPEALTIKYRRPDLAEPPAPMVAAAAPGSLAAAPPEPGEAEPAGPPTPPPPTPVLESLLTVPPTSPEPEPEDAERRRVFFPKERRKVLVAAVVALFVTGTGVLTGVSLWGSARPDTIGPANVAALPPEAAPAEAAPAPAPPETTVTALVPTVAAVGTPVREGAVGDPFERLAVRVTDPEGRPLEGIAVRFVVAEGESSVSPATATTGPDGTAAARWIPREAGLHAVEAQVVDADVAPVRFEAHAGPRAPARLARVSSANLRGTAGSATTSPLVVRVEDERGRPLAGVPVRFAVRAGNGRVEQEVMTRANGTASTRWVLGPDETQTVVATVPTLAGDSIVFRASVRAAALAVRAGLEAGGTHTCMLAANGTAACWGGNDSGQLGDGSGTRRSGPTAVRAPEPFAALSAGVSHTCGLAVSGSVYCWGANAAGQLGDGGTGGRTEPARVASDQRFTGVLAGMSHTCALGGAGQLYCWGRNSQGQLGDGTRTSRSAPTRVAGGRTWRSVALGWNHTCALARDGSAWCWGRNANGELGDGSTRDRAEPAAVAGGHRFTALAAGSGHTCGLRGDGVILCWGHSAQGQLGNASNESSAVPVPVQAGVAFTSLTAGGVHTCALARDGAAWCWGRNNYGQLGEGTFADRSVPMVVETSRRFTRLTATGAHTCGIATGGQELCWGFNADGQLGDGTRNNQPRPVVVRRGG